MTALTRVTTRETPTVSLSAATACGLLTALQNELDPSSKAPFTRAANGIRTITLM